MFNSRSKDTYTVELRRTIKKVKLLGYRIHGSSKSRDLRFVPYCLAAYLGLMPKDGCWTVFKDVLYSLTPKELAELRPYNEITKVTRKGGSVFVTIDFSKM